jgi:hypothetical protein
MTYDYTKSDVNVAQLSNAIKASAIVTTLLSVNHSGSDLSIIFDGALSAGDKTILDGLVSAHVASEVGEKNFLVKEYSNGSRTLLKETWYHTDNGDDTYADIVEETVYSYTGNKVDSYTVTSYLKDGTAIEAKTYNYFTNGDKVILKRV